MTSQTTRQLFYAMQAFCIISSAISDFKLELQSENAKFASLSAIFCPGGTWNLTGDLWKNTVALLCYFKLFVSFHRHWWLQTRVTVRKHPIRVKIDDYLSRATWKFDRWPWKTTLHISYATYSFMHNFVAICEFKLKLESGNAQFGSKSAIFCPAWPLNLKNDLEKL